MMKFVTALSVSLAFATPAFAQQPWDGWTWNPFPKYEEPEEYTPYSQPHHFHRPHIQKHINKPIMPGMPMPPKALHVDATVFDKNVNFHQTSAITLMNPVGEEPGTIVIDTKSRRLYFVQEGGTAIRYKIAVGKKGFSWKGNTQIREKTKWPAWTPPKAMLERRPELQDHMDGGPNNPLGARALYLFDGEKDTLFRIHGNNDPSSIGKNASSGCFRMNNADVIDLYNRVTIGTKVIVR